MNRNSQHSANPLIAKVQQLFSRDLALENDYLRQENKILRSKLGIRVPLTEADRRILVKYGLRIKTRLAEVMSIAKPQTLLAWNRRQKQKKWTFDNHSTKAGPPRKAGGCRWQKRYRMRPGRRGGSAERELSGPVTGDPLAREPNGSSPAAASQRALHRRSSPRYSIPGLATIATSGRRAFVAMVQAAHLGERDDLALRTLHWSWFRGIFVQAQMGPTAVVIFEVGFE